jgi:hypothetical protein
MDSALPSMAEPPNRILRPLEEDDEPAVRLQNVVPHRFLQDLDGWLEFNGLRSAEDVLDQGETASTQEERLRVSEEDQYVKSIHNAAFLDSIEQEAHDRNEKKLFFSRWRGRTMDIHTAEKDCIYNVPLDRMAQMCETVYVMARNKFRNVDGSNGKCAVAIDWNYSFHLSLKSYSKSSVQEFVNVVLSHSSCDSALKEKEENKVFTGENTAWVATAVDQISNDALLDCCRIAHYLMAEPVVNAITNVLLDSIDTENCFVICQLADELSLSSTLMERALIHMMDTIGEVNIGKAEESGWDDTGVWSKEWKERILLLKRALESSSMQHRRLYFSSIEEYLSIFAERVQYYKERLAEAKECHRMSHPRNIGSCGWLDAQRKIERQEQRVRTLEMALAEQKGLFRASKFFRRG